jgi:hypothetical protein
MVLNSSIHPWIGYIQMDVAFLSLPWMDLDVYKSNPKPMDGQNILGISMDLWHKNPHGWIWTGYPDKSMWMDLGPWIN